MKRSQESLSAALRSRDMLLGGVTRTIEDLDRIINQLGERLEDWYGIYFPELRMDDKLKYCEAVLNIDRANLDIQELATVFGQKKAEEIVASSEKSLGAMLQPADMSQCHTLAREIISLGKLRDDYLAYQKTLAIEICPNMSIVGGPEIAAKLVSHVGSLMRLAILPASTIQVLGAEKALFKHLKNKRIDPPKHGIIFQHPRISASPKMVRGKIARALANKLALAVRADAFTKRDISAELKKDFDTRYDQIMAEYERKKAKGGAEKGAPGKSPAPPE